MFGGHIRPIALIASAIAAVSASSASAQTIDVSGPYDITVDNQFGIGPNLAVVGNTSFAFAGGFELGNEINIGAGLTLTNIVPGSDEATLSGPIGGNGGLVKSGTGVLILSGPNSYLGGTQITDGTLRLDPAATWTAIGPLVIGANGTFDIGANPQVVVGSLAGGGDVTGTGLLVAGLDGTSTTFSGTVAPAFAKIGTGTMAIDNARFNSAFIGGGAFSQTNGTATSFEMLSVGFGGTGSTGPGTLNVFGGVLTVGTTMAVGDFTGTGTVNQMGGTVQLVPSCTDPEACVSLNIGNQGGTGIYNISGGTLELNGGLNNLGRNDGANPAGQGTLSITGDGLVVLRPGLSAGSLILGSRVDTTPAGGAHGEGIIDQDGGILRIENGSSLFLSAYGNGTYNLDGGVLQIGGNSLQAHYGGGAALGTYEFNLGGGTIQAYGTALTASVNATLVSGASTFDTNGLGITWNGVLDGAGALSKIGAGALTLSGNNTYTGGTQLNAGTIVAGSNTALGTGTLSFNAASTLRFGGNFTLANAMTIAPDVVASIDTNGNTLTAINGIIDGDGALVKVGAGALTLNGANSYTGGTRVAAGTLQLGASNRLASSGALEVDAGALFNLLGNQQTVGAFSGAGTVILGGASGALTTDSASTTVFSGDIEGGGSFTKGGSGTLFLTGTSGYNGPTTINGGELVVDGSVANSQVTVNGGTLGGVGTVGALIVQSAGTVAPGAPGNSIGTLNVAGTVTFQPGSTFQVGVNAAGASDRIAATGAAIINGGTVQVLAQGGAYSPLMTYTILTSAGLSGPLFEGVTSNLIFLQPTLDYDANNVYLHLARTSFDFAEFALTPNELAVANALDQFPDSAGLLPFLLSQDAQGIRQAFDALSGEVHASASSALVMNSFYVREALFSRMVQAYYSGGGGEPSVLGGAAPTTVALLDTGSRMSLGAGLDDVRPAVGGIPAYAHGLAFWTRGFGAWGDLNGNGNAAGLDRTLGGFISGVDARIGGGWRAGLATGYMHSDLGVGARASSADIDSYVLAGYAGGAAGPFAIRSGGAWTWNNLDTTRNVIFPGFFENEQASYNAGTGQLFAEIAYPMLYAGGAAEPFAGLSYIHVGTDGFTESGTLAGLTSGGSDQNVGVSLLGLRAGTSFPVYGLAVTPHGSLAWQYAFGDVTPEQAFAFASTGIGFGIAGVPIARSSALIQGGIDLNLDTDMVLGVNYTGQLADGFNDNSVQGRFNWRF